jgi:hypothetical protein
MSKVDENPAANDTSPSECIRASLERIHKRLDARRPGAGFGRIVATSGASATFTALEIRECLARHVTGDWGDLDAADKCANADAITTGARLLSAYKVGDDRRLWIITEAVGDDGERASTCVLTPEEY